MLLALLFLSGTPLHAADYPLTRGPEGRFLIEVTVGEGKAFPFVLDTGSGRTMVYRTLVTDLGLEPMPAETVQVQTATGLRALQLYKVGTLQALGRSLTGDGLALMPDVDKPGIYGIVGVDILAGMMLEIGGDHVRVVVPDEPLPTGPWYQVEGRPVASGSLAVDVHLQGLAIPALVDTGANFTIINHAALVQLLQRGDVAVTDSGTGIRSAGGAMRAGTFTADSLLIGGKRYSGVRVLVADLPVFAALGAAQVPAMILGADIIGRQRVVIDFHDWALWLEKGTD